MQGKKKKKKADGGFLDQYGKPLQQGTLLAGSLIGANTPGVGGAAIGGALKGAGAGLALGPIGAVAGGLLGGILGGRAKRKEQEQLAEIKDEQKGLQTLQLQENLISNSGRQLAKGGKLKNKLNLVGGGDLNPVSEDAVEVVANNPNATDSVELDSAFVDNNEIIDKENRVFSDDLTLPSGRSIAKEAKRLEKMKSDNPRFLESNERIGQKLDSLFDYQEGLKSDPGPKTKKKPTYSPTGNYTERMLNKWDSVLQTKEPYGVDREAYLDKAYKKIRKQVVRQLDAEDMAKAKKPSKAVGGKLDENNPYGTIDTLRPDVQVQNKPFDMQPLLTTAATFGPNLNNALLQKRLKGPKAPQLESAVQLKKINPNAQLADVNRAYNQAKEVITSNTSQGSNLASSIGNLMAKRVAGQNQVYGQTNQINTSIQNQQAGLNQGVKARNAGRINDFQDSVVNFQNKKLQLSSENVSNLSGKILQIGRERNQMQRDSEALEIMKQAYGDSNVLSRLSPEAMAALEKYSKQGKRKGGKLNIKK